MRRGNYARKLNRNYPRDPNDRVDLVKYGMQKTNLTREMTWVKSFDCDKEEDKKPVKSSIQYSFEFKIVDTP